jgi:hypothetical protein
MTYLRAKRAKRERESEREQRDENVGYQITSSILLISAKKYFNNVRFDFNLI